MGRLPLVATLYQPLMEAIKGSFLDTAQHYESLGKHDGQYAALLTFAALDQVDTFSVAEFAAATRALPADGLCDAAQALVQSLEGAGDQRADHWKHRILHIYNRSGQNCARKIHPAISEKLAMLCVVAHEAFPKHLRSCGIGCNRLSIPTT